MDKSHYNLVRTLLDEAITDSEKQQYASFMENMHVKCRAKKLEDCNVPCHVQDTKRRKFCVYKPGDMMSLDAESTHLIANLNEKDERIMIFLRRENRFPSNEKLLSHGKPRTNHQPVSIYVPYTLDIDILFELKHFANHDEICNISEGIPGTTNINAVLRQGAHVHTKIPNLSFDMLSDLYKVYHFDIDIEHTMNNLFERLIQLICNHYNLKLKSKSSTPATFYEGALEAFMLETYNVFKESVSKDLKKKLQES